MAYTTIKKPSDYFNTKLYTGNGTTQSITGVGFQPDWTWVKERSSTSSHQIIDAVRGYNRRLGSDNSNAESVDSSPYNDFKSIDSDGFTIGSGGGVNANSDTYAAWNWKANGAGSANTDGSISSTVSANTTSGFSIVKYTGTGADMTVGHGLNAVPKMIIVKALDTGTDPWWVYHASLGNSAKLRLNETDASSTTADYIWNQTTPTSSVFSLDGANNGSNANGNDFIAYCFADVQGYSKFGSYVGNGNADGTFIYTGFSPAFIITKPTSTTGQWTMFDNKRDSANVGNKKYLHPNTSGDEGDANSFDFLSNGFKLKLSGGDINTSGATFIYMAFAEQPLVGDNPATAR